MSGFNTTIGQLTNGAQSGGILRNTSATAAALTISGSDTSAAAFSGALQDGTGGGALSLVRSGTGTAILSGTNTYTGATTINASALQVNGSLASGSAVTVNTGGTLGGTGDTVNVNTGGAFRGGTGTSTGALNLGNTATVNSGGTIAAALSTSNASSVLALGTNTLNLITGSKVAVTGVGGLTRAGLGSYTIASFTNGNTLQLDGTGSRADGFVFGTYVQGTGASGAVVIDVSGLGFALTAGDTFELNRTGNNLVLQFAPVPEPATVLAVGAAGLAVAGWARRRRNAPAATTAV